LLHVPWPRFIVPELVAVLLWVTYDVTPVAFGNALPAWTTVPRVRSATWWTRSPLPGSGDS
jgi:hypothetical protein